MALNLIRTVRRDCKIIFSARFYSKKPAYRQAEEDKSRHQRDEEGKKPRIIHGQEYPDWRKPWGERKNEQFSFFRPFVSEVNPKPDILYAMSQIPLMSMDRVRSWWKTMKEYNDIENQRYISERVEMLGANLASAHFFLYRNCSIRWRNSKQWIKGYITDPKAVIKLPSVFEEGYFVEAIDASTFHKGGIRYEGLENLDGLQFLKWLSLRNSKFVDEWCIDRIAGCVGNSLQFLDISGCSVNVGTVIALSRMRQLKYLVITELGEDKEIEAALADLEEVNPKLLIRYVDASGENSDASV